MDGRTILKDGSAMPTGRSSVHVNGHSGCIKCEELVGCLRQSDWCCLLPALLQCLKIFLLWLQTPKFSPNVALLMLCMQMAGHSRNTLTENSLQFWRDRFMCLYLQQKAASCFDLSECWLFVQCSLQGRLCSEQSGNSLTVPSCCCQKNHCIPIAAGQLEF